MSKQHDTLSLAVPVRAYRLLRFRLDAVPLDSSLVSKACNAHPSSVSNCGSGDFTSLPSTSWEGDGKFLDTKVRIRRLGSGYSMLVLVGFHIKVLRYLRVLGGRQLILQLTLILVYLPSPASCGDTGPQSPSD